MNNTKKGTTIISTTLAGLITASAACLPESNKDYVKDDHIQVEAHRFVEPMRLQERSNLQFQSGCNYLSVTIYPTDLGPAYDVYIQESFDFDCASKPHIPEVDKLLGLIYRYATPDPRCELFDHEGKKFRPSRLDAPLLAKCHAHKDAKKIGDCLLAEAPPMWRVDCK